MKVCIDPGLSSEPPGPEASLEAEINMSISRYLGDALLNSGYSVVFTREDDVEDDSFAFRISVANAAFANVFVSLHCIQTEQPVAGVETTYFPASEEGFRLANCIQTELASLDYSEDRGVAEADFPMLRFTEMPAVLIKCGCINHPADRKILLAEEGKQKIASAIALGIETYFLDHK